MSFGEQARIIHPLGEPFTDQTGGKLMHEFTFDEDDTKIGQLVELATAEFEERGRLDDSDKPAQLLVIMSDGRRIKSEGSDILSNAIRSAKLNGILIVFIIIDNPTSKVNTKYNNYLCIYFYDLYINFMKQFLLDLEK